MIVLEGGQCLAEVIGEENADEMQGEIVGEWFVQRQGTL